MYDRFLNSPAFRPRSAITTCKGAAFSLAALLLIVASSFASMRGVHVDPDFFVDPIIVGGPGRVDKILELSDGNILVGGGISSISGGATQGIAKLNSDGSFDSSFQGRADNRVKGIFEVAGGKFLISGDFLAYDGVSRNRIARINSDGTLDPTFSPNFGTLYVQIVAVQLDGKIIVNGTFTEIAGVQRNRLARLHADGSLDTSFTVGLGPNNAGINKAVVQADGKIVLAGSFSSYDGVTRNGILRLNSDGSIDTAFSPDITFTVEFFDFSILDDGRIYVVGDKPGAQTIMRLGSNGVIDTTFNTNIVSTNNGRLYSIATLANGQPVVGGEFEGFRVNGVSTSCQRLCRFNLDGSVDTTFTATAGDSNSSGGVRELYLQTDGKILVGGDFPFLAGYRRGGLGRLNADATYDVTFIGFFGSFTTINVSKLLPNQKILVGGSFDALGTDFRRNLARLNPNGSIDSTFFLDPRVDNLISSIAVQTDGKLVLGGYTGDDFNRILSKGIWRVHPDGNLDASFDAQIGRLEFVRTVALQSDGKMLIGGDFSQVNGVARIRIARLNSDGTLDSTFNPVLGSPGVFVNKIVLQPDGKILVGGGFASVNGSPIANLVRLNTDGSVDHTFQIGAGANSPVSEFLLSDGKIYVGGAFSTFSGVTRRSIVRLNADGTFDTSFKSVRISGAVRTILKLPDGNILIGGSVDSLVDASPRANILRLLNDGSIDFGFNAGSLWRNLSQGSISQLMLQDNGQIIGVGPFDDFDGIRRWGLVRLIPENRKSVPRADFDGDGKTDISVFRPSDGNWYRLNSHSNGFRALNFGLSEDVVSPGDFDGDDLTDVAVFRPSTGIWYFIGSSDNSFNALQFGLNGDIPVPADFDGDDRTDIAVFRPSTSIWYILRSSDGGVTITGFGAAGDVPVTADYDGDGKDDIGIYRSNGATGGEWWIDRSTAGLLAMQFGGATDRTVPGDYTGDGKADIAFWRPSTGEWYIVRSEDFSYYAFPFGQNGDIPAPGDYDGDGKMDAAVFRNGIWYIAGSTTGTQIVGFGVAGDKPIPNAFVR